MACSRRSDTEVLGVTTPLGNEPLSQTIEGVSEMTLLLPIKQGLTTQLDPTFLPQLFNPALPQVRWADNLRKALTLVKGFVERGQITALNQMATIHYARWVLIDDDARLLFTSNFDGSWERYLRDFAIVANPREMPWMDLVWRNCVGYPGTDDFQDFGDWVRKYQVETTLFFPNIPEATVRDIAYLRKFKQRFDAFDQEVQAVDRSRWPTQLARIYDQFKRDAAQIDVLVVGE